MNARGRRALRGTSRARALRVGPLFLLSVAVGAGAQEPAAGDPASAEDVVRSLYDLVSSGPSAPPDWEAVRELFLPEAVIVLRTTREALTVFSVDGFLQDFRAFYESPDVTENGFRETVLDLRATKVGDIAQAWVLYEARVPGGRGNRGLDAFLLVRRGDRWQVAAVTNEVPMPGRPVPEDLFD
jgi:hypothetical protein